MKIRCVYGIAFFCFFVLSPFAHAQTLLTTPTVIDYSPFFKDLSPEARDQLEETLYSRYFTPVDRVLTYKERIDAFIIGRFTLSARERYQENPTSFEEEMGDAQQSLRQAQAILYKLYGISDFPLEKLDEEIKDLKYDLLSDLFTHLPAPTLGGVSMKTAHGIISTIASLEKIQDLEIKRKFLQAVDLELPTSVDEIQKVYLLARRASKKLPPEFSAQIDTYFAGDPSAVSIRANLDTLISHHPMIKNKVDLLMASGQVASLEQAVLIVQKSIEAVEMTIEQQHKEEEIRVTYLELRKATSAVSSIIGFFDRDIQMPFNRIANPLINMSEAYSTLKVVTTGGVKLDTKTLAACATGIGAVFALADFFITSPQPSDMEILMEHLNSQFEKLHERFDKLHEHLDFIHADLRKAVSDLFSVMQQRFGTMDHKLEEIKKVLDRHGEKLKIIEDLIRDQRNETRNIEIDKDRLALDQSIRRYQDEAVPLEECLFDCVSYSEGVAKRLPNLRDMKGNHSDIQNGFFHKVLEAPYFVNLSQLLNLAYPDLPKGSEPRVGVYEDEYDRALRQESRDKFTK